MSRSICFLLFCLCILPVAAYSAEEPGGKYQITIGKLQCLYEHTERLLSKPGSSFEVLLSEQCEDIAIKVEDSGIPRGSEDEETLLGGKLPNNQATSSDIAEVIIRLTRTELKCLRKEFENLELENKANSKEELLVYVANSCKILSAS